MSHGFDQEIVQDFITECGELMQQLEGDLVVLEASPKDPELLNKVFRALHTIKGSASFLQLTNLVSVAHAAESALNSARNNIVTVDSACMNLLLEACDTIKTQMEQVASGQELMVPRAQLVADLAAIGEGKVLQSSGSTGSGQSAPVQNSQDVQQASQSKNVGNDTNSPVSTNAGSANASGKPTAARKMQLGPGKADLLEYLVADLDETMNKVQASLNELAGASDPKSSAKQLAETCEQLSRCVDFFEFAQMGELAQAMSKAADKLSSSESHVHSAMPQLQALYELVTHQASGIKQGELREVSADDVLGQLSNAFAGGGTPVVRPELPATGSAATTTASAVPVTDASNDKPVDKNAEKAAEKPQAEKHANAAVENTIRVEVGRLEALMNLVGELVLQKNRITSLTRKATSASHVELELAEAMNLAASSLDRVTGDIQTAVMRTRMQPLDKLFGRYPRLIRDLASKTGKHIQLLIEGGDTEVDKSVIEELGDPLVHLIRNSADHGLENPDERTKAGKNEQGTITLRASHEGSHVRVLVMDDGRGLSRERIAKKAVERGLVTQDQVALLSDREVFNFIFEAGFSTAEKVSDLSGRGVGMDVVRTNISRLKGSIDLSSEFGKGTTVAITIPLTVAILPAMMVEVGKETYAVPLASIIEIVKPEESRVSTIGGAGVLRVRDSVLPLISASNALSVPQQSRSAEPFALVMSSGDRRVALSVSRLIGQQEVVIKPLDEHERSTKRAVSGATVRDDGGVSLIIDVEHIVNSHKPDPTRTHS